MALREVPLRPLAAAATAWRASPQVEGCRPLGPYIEGGRGCRVVGVEGLNVEGWVLRGGC